MVFTGSFVYLQWAKESTFGTAAANISAACAENFGFEQKITSWSFTNNKIPLSQLNDVRVKTYAYGQTRGSISLDFVLSSPWFFELIGFKDGSTAGVGPYTHTWDLDNTSATNTIQPFTTQVGQEAGSCDIVRTMSGGIVNSATITTAIGDTVKVSLDTSYVNESMSTTVDACPAALSVCDHVPFTFAHGSLEFPDCTTIAEVQDVDITFAQNSDHIFGIGSSVAVSGIRRLFDISGKFRASYTDTVQLQKLYAQQKDTLCNTAAGAETLLAEQPTLKLTFDNGLAGTSQRKITISLSGISLADHNLNIEPNEPIYEDLNFQARDADVVAITNTSTIPAAS